MVRAPTASPSVRWLAWQGLTGPWWPVCCRVTAPRWAGPTLPRRPTPCRPGRCGWPPTSTRRCPRRAGWRPATAPWWRPSGRRPAWSPWSWASRTRRLYDLSAQVLGVRPEQTLAIGDRLDTDIAGANAAGMPSLLVLTGVHGVREAARATASERPRYLATDLRALADPYAEAVRSGDGWSCGGARAEVGVDGTVHAGRRGIARRAAALRGRSAVGRGRRTAPSCPALTTRRGTGWSMRWPGEV